jgi:hypothetical protein
MSQILKLIIAMLFKKMTAATETGNVTSPRSQRVISKAFEVSGHWRSQWVGSESSGTRKCVDKWINPFKKGV